MKLTRDNIHDAKSESGGWTKEQLSILGVHWPPQKGWLTRLIGKEIPDEDYKHFLLLKGHKRVRLTKPEHLGRPKEHPDLFSETEKSPEDFANEMYLNNSDDFE